MTSEAVKLLRERAPAAADTLERAAGPLAETLPGVLAASDFLLDALARDATLPALLTSRAAERLEGEPLPVSPTQPGDEQRFMNELRRWRRAELARIAWRDLAGWSDLDETLQDLSRAAELALNWAHDFAFEMLAQRFGAPCSPAGEPQRLMIVAMGKLGGRELNFSSDVDLVLLYPQGGATRGARCIDNQEFFTRLARLLIRLLAEQTEAGWVYRVDLRLRPFGDSGPIVCSAAALEDYLQIHGRDWERYAWIKARAVTDPEACAELFRSTVSPFVYRRYLDFGVFDALREMKALIEREGIRRDRADDIKLGEGGIRELEFIVQSFQLVRGGQDRRLQQPSLRRVLPLLSGAKLLPRTAVAALDEAYVFLRRLENRLQMRADQQLHRLPAGAAERARLSATMGYAAWPQLAAAIARHRSCVAEHFRALLSGVPAGEAAVGAGVAPAAATPLPLPLESLDTEVLAERLAALGYADPAQAGEAAHLLATFAHAVPIRRLDPGGARRLMALLPVLVADSAASGQPLPVLRRLLTVLEAIGSRSAYFALLLHQQGPRLRLVQLASHGEFLIRQIASHPLLLDELIDPDIFGDPPDRAALAEDLEQRMAGADPDDEEQLIERLRQFQRAAVFRFAVADLLARLPVMRVSDRLTDVAELIVERALQLAWAHTTGRLGAPMCGSGPGRRAVGVIVVGYGKLGGMELGYASDLDLVFLHDSTGEQAQTEAGPRSVDNPVFFVRFAQRLLHMLSVHSPAGRLYDVDTRLRPSGKAGLLVTSIEAFAEYQRHEAWTYEHQALLHARAVAGPAELRRRFEAIRMDVLAHAVRRERLLEEVRHMRNRMRQELSQAGAAEFDVKQDPGGIADIEFLAQYWALRWAAQYPPVARYADTIRQLESVGSADLVPQTTIDRLTAAYRRYRSCVHHRALDGLQGIVAASEFADERAAVLEVWNREMGSAPSG